MILDSELFRTVMASFPAGVTVVTAVGADGQPQGCTVSAVCSVSLEPPLLLVCIDKGSNTLPAITHSGAFTVNFLRSESSDLALRFAAKQTGKFEDVESVPSPVAHGGPVLAGESCAWSVCTLTASLEAGDHWILVGRMEAGEVWADREPLVYCRRTFAGWAGQAS